MKHHHHPNLRMERWQRRTVYGVIAALTISGVLWLWAHYFLHQNGEFGPVIHPLEIISIKLHGLCAMLTLFFVGSILNGHIRRALKYRHNLTTGWGMVAAMLWLTISGYALYYLVNEGNRSLASWLHVAPGLGLPLLVAWHIRRGRSRSGLPGNELPL